MSFKFPIAFAVLYCFIILILPIILCEFTFHLGNAKLEIIYIE